MKSFAVRTGSTVVLVGSFAAVVALGHVPLALMILGIQALMVRELLALAARARAGERAPASTANGSGSGTAGGGGGGRASAGSSTATGLGLGGSGFGGGIGGGWYFFCVAAFWIYLRFIHKQLEVEVGTAAATAALEEEAAYKLEAAAAASSSSSNYPAPSMFFLASSPSLASLLASLRARSAGAAAWVLRRHTFVAFALYTLGWVSFVLRLERGCYLYQFRQFAWTHLILLLVFVPSSFFVSNIFDGIVWFLLPASLVVRCFFSSFSRFFLSFFFFFLLFFLSLLKTLPPSPSLPPSLPLSYIQNLQQQKQVINDIAAYVAGFFFGRTPLIKLSPKKTWEGFAGGAVGTVLASWFLAEMMSRSTWLTCPRTDLSMGALKCDPGPTYARTTFRVSELLLPAGAERGAFGSALQRLANGPFGSFSFVARPMQLHAVALAAFASLVAPFGGFFASGLKRSLKVKDFGHSIPGHGGMTDRMDCQVVMAVFSYLYYHACVAEDEDYGYGGDAGTGGLGGFGGRKKAASAAALAAAAAVLPAVERLRLAASLVAGVASSRADPSSAAGAEPSALSGIAAVLEAAAEEEAASAAVVVAAA